MLPNPRGRGWKAMMASIGMTRDEVIQRLRAHSNVLVERFGTTALALFGSTVRDGARYDSYTGILIRFDGPAT